MLDQVIKLIYASRATLRSWPKTQELKLADHENGMMNSCTCRFDSLLHDLAYNRVLVVFRAPNVVLYAQRSSLFGMNHESEHVP